MNTHNLVIRTSALILVAVINSTVLAESEDGEYIDFTDQMTSMCEVAKLTVPPPSGWINVPIQSDESTFKGCQMMLIVDQALIGILRVLSFDLGDPTKDTPPWYQHIIGLESELISVMGYRLIEPIWKRDQVPISGANFSGGRAFGFSAIIEGNDNPQEAHFLVFENTTHKYLISLLTPAKTVDDGTYYKSNADGMATVMKTFKAKK